MPLLHIGNSIQLLVVLIQATSSPETWDRAQLHDYIYYWKCWQYFRPDFLTNI